MEVFYFLFGWLLGERQKSCKDYNKNFIKLDDKNYIVNNEFVSFEEDTPILRMQQDREDKKHYRNYESQRLMRDFKEITNNHMSTIMAIAKYPELRNCVTPENLAKIEEDYNYYCKKCEKHNITLKLTKEEFLIKETHPSLCIDWGSFGIFVLNPISYCYTIYNEKTAKYKGGNMMDKIKEEFKEKWY